MPGRTPPFLRTLILEPDPLIAADISEIVQYLIPGAEINTQNTTDDIAGLAKSGPPWNLVIADKRLFRNDGATVRALLESASTFRVLLDEDGGADLGMTPGWLPLAFPFSDDMLRGALSSVLERAHLRNQ